jgi:hypothetical protein
MAFLMADMVGAGRLASTAWGLGWYKRFSRLADRFDKQAEVYKKAATRCI